MNKFTRRILRQKKQQERISFRYYNTAFKSGIDIIVSSYTGSIEALIGPVNLLLSQTSQSVTGATLRTWGNCGGVFGYESREDTISNSKRIRSLRIKEATKEQWVETFTENATGFISTTVAEKTNQILGTQSDIITRQLNNILTQTIEQGLSIDETMELIQGDFKRWGYDMSKRRARMIARTEVNSASNWAQTNGAESLGVPLEKFWSTSGLPNIRESHLKCQAQGWIDNSRVFINGLKFPGDQSTSNLSEFINCRCTAQYRAKLV